MAYNHPTSPHRASQGQRGHVLSGDAACPTCGRIRWATFDGAAVRCMGCWHRWIPQPPALVVQ